MARRPVVRLGQRMVGNAMIDSKLVLTGPRRDLDRQLRRIERLSQGRELDCPVVPDDEPDQLRALALRLERLEREREPG